MTTFFAGRCVFLTIESVPSLWQATALQVALDPGGRS
jgi:hypothetical protein